MNADILDHLSPLVANKNPKVISDLCTVFRYLILDDDIRVEFGKAHEHAKKIADQVLSDLTKLLNETKNIDLYDFLKEADLDVYYNSIKTDLKITSTLHLKYAHDDDFKQIGFSRPEIRRLRKFYDKHFSRGYLTKIKRLLQHTLKDNESMGDLMLLPEPVKTVTSPSKLSASKHIIPADSISVNKQLGSGEFGIVQQGVWTNGTERIQVAIKCLCRERMQSHPMEFLKEAAIMHAIEHENIVRLYGVVLDTDALMLVTELAHLRSLLECLKDPGLRVSFVTVTTLCEFAKQICNGMMYLEEKRLIHRDLAARNILVFNKDKVKISDFGLSRALGVGKDYYKTNFNVNLKLPIAWCAPECINYLRFTNASDVWAYGVCLWEMFSYGFQPWAALTGLQILEAIDEPNYQRLEQPECAPREYYLLMLECWQHDPHKRLKFREIYNMLGSIKPEQLKAITTCSEPKKDFLTFRHGEIVTVLDKSINSIYWKGILNSGKTGYFNSTNMVPYIEEQLCPTKRDSLLSSKRKFKTEMISLPQSNLQQSGHSGCEGTYFRNAANFLTNSQSYNHPPQQIVAPYKTSEDIEQTPLLMPQTPTSPDIPQAVGKYFSDDIISSPTQSSFRNSDKNACGITSSDSFRFMSRNTVSSSNPFNQNLNLRDNKDNKYSENEAMHFDNELLQHVSLSNTNTDDVQHEYHEISDDEAIDNKVFDLGPSLLDEINSIFGSISTKHNECSLKMHNPPNKTCEDIAMPLKINHKSTDKDTFGSKYKKKNNGIVKRISVKDAKILNHVIEFANEISEKSMTNLVSDNTSSVQSPKRKFGFRFPNLSHNMSNEKDGGCSTMGHFQLTDNGIHQKDRKVFSEELKNICDLQNSITEQHREAYNSLIEKRDLCCSNVRCDLLKCDLPIAKMLPHKFLTLEHKRHVSVANNSFSNNSHIVVPLEDAPHPISKSSNTTLRIHMQNKNSLNNGEDNAKLQLSACESPNYLSNAAYSFSVSDINLLVEPTECNLKPHATNIIPLPPRDRSKPITTNTKRHIRKHPLVLPGYSMQIPLNKQINVTPATTAECKSDQISYATYPVKCCNNMTSKDCSSYSKIMNSSPISRNYENINNNNESNINDHEESMTENNAEKINFIPFFSEFCSFHMQKGNSKKKNVEISGIYVNEDEIKNLDIDLMRSDTAQKNCQCLETKNYAYGLKSNNSKGKMNDSSNKSDLSLKNISLNDNKQDKETEFSGSYSVSFEDLLEFSNKNSANINQRLDSDEVRIMLKVLNKASATKERCLVALEFINWDVHKAIKIIKLQDMFNMQLSYKGAIDVLENHDWDLELSLSNLTGINR